MKPTELELIYIEKKITQGLENVKIPEYMHGGILGYFLEGVPPGSFLVAVLCNDLVGAIASADHNNRGCLGEYASFLTWYAPAITWGSEEKVQNWIERFKEE